MEFTVDQTGFKWIMDSQGAWLMILHPDREKVQEFIKTLDKPQAVTIKTYREKRTIDQNAYLWKLTNELANVLLISKEECYLRLLKNYSQSSIVSVLNEAVPMFLRAIKYYDIMSESELNGKTFTHIKVYMGSSEMNTKEAWILTQGLIDECQEQGIPTDTPEEIERLKALWEKEK